MQELRFVLIVVGALAIAALLFHGLWTSKKESKSKFGDKPLGKLVVEGDGIADRSAERGFAPENDVDMMTKERKEPDLSVEPLDIDPLASDPLVDSYADVDEKDVAANAIGANTIGVQDYAIEHDVPSMSAVAETVVVEPLKESIQVNNPVQFTEIKREESQLSDGQSEMLEDTKPDDCATTKTVEQAEMEVIVLNVHCSGEQPFVGTKLFDSMQKHGLQYGEMDIFHRHADLSGTGKVLFSVANMMQPGTLKHDDPAEFTTKGISFFMTLPCFGDGGQNFKLMLKTAQQIADDLSANVLDDRRNLITPNRLDAYRAQIKQFNAVQPS